MLKRLILMALLLVSVNARAAEYTDVYYDPAEDGWGVFLVQSDATQFLAFFIYGSDGTPTWYVAILAQDATGKFTGTLFATTGTYFPNPWQGKNTVAAGTATFTPIDAYHATLSYTVNGIGTVTKEVQRQTLTGYVLSGNYSGAGAGSIVNCPNPGQNEPVYRSRFDAVVTQVADQSATLVFTFVDPAHAGLVCTLTGALTHFGRLYQLNGQSSCTANGAPVGQVQALTIDNFHTTSHGIEGHITAIDGCTASVHFSAVLDTNN